MATLRNVQLHLEGKEEVPRKELSEGARNVELGNKQ
jgi:hypothetical protein